MSAWDIVFWIVLGTVILALLPVKPDRPRDEVDRLAERRARELASRDC